MWTCRATRIQNNHGSLAIELVLASAVLGLIVVTGMGAIRFHLESSLRQLRNDQEWLDMESLRQSISTAWDHRYGHKFVQGYWLEIDSSFEGEFLKLERLWIRHYNQDGTLSESSWSHVGDGWELLVRKRDSPDYGTLSRKFRYDGRIQVNMETGRYIGGEGPDLLEFSFPEMRTKRLRQGFAIRRHW